MNIKRIALICVLLGAIAAVIWCPGPDHDEAASTAGTPPIDHQLGELLREHEVTPLQAPPARSSSRVALGRALFFDPIVSASRDVSCATCHHPCKATGDARSLSVGTRFRLEDGVRFPGPKHEFIARNATELFNRGQPQWETMFWDSRLSKEAEGLFVVHNAVKTSSVKVPPSQRLPLGLDNLLAAQALLPLLARDEMRGDPGDLDIDGHPSTIANLSDAQREEIWQALLDRIMATPGYRDLIEAAYPDRTVEEIDITHLANALADFEIEAFTLLDSPWDRYLEGEEQALSSAEKRGAMIFYGKAGCAQCHTGALMTDQKPHNIGVPQLGPGKEPARPLDEGVFLRSHGRAEDRFAFRTPPLRNVAHTGPWMHNGAYTNLEDAVRHHLDPPQAWRRFRAQRLERALHNSVREDSSTRTAILKTLDPAVRSPVELSGEEVNDVVSFLGALSSPSLNSLSEHVPDSVPSKLAVETCSDPTNQIPSSD